MENQNEIGAFKASFLIIRESFRILMQDKEMLLYPVFAFFTHIIILSLFCISYFFVVLGGSLEAKVVSGDGMLSFIFFFAYYIVSNFVTNFYQTGVFSVAHARFSGRDLSFVNGMSIAFKKFGVLLLWSTILATVGTIISIIERQKLVGWIVAKILGVAWAILTYFSLPLLVVGDREIKDSFQESASIIKKTWGETVVVYFGTGYATFLFTLSILLIPILSFFVPEQLFLFVLLSLSAFSFIMLICLAVVTSTLNAIFKLALYEYALTGVIPQGFSEVVIRRSIRSKTNMSPKKYSTVILIVFIGTICWYYFGVFRNKPTLPASNENNLPIKVVDTSDSVKDNFTKIIDSDVKITSLFTVEGKLGYSARNKDFSDFIVIDGKKYQNDYSVYLPVEVFSDKVAYTASKENNNYFVVYNNQEIKSELGDTSHPAIVGGKLAYVITDKNGKSFIALDQKEFGKEYETANYPVDVNGELAYIGKKSNGKFIINLSSKETSKEYDYIESLISLDNKIAFIATSGDRRFVVSDKKEIDNDYEISSPGDLLTINNKLTYEVYKNDKSFIVYGDQEVGKEYKKATLPKELGKKLAYVAILENNTVFYVYDEKEIGREGGYSWVGFPILVNGKLVYLASKETDPSWGDKIYIIYNGEKIDSGFDRATFFYKSNVNIMADVNGKLNFVVKNGNSSIVYAEK